MASITKVNELIIHQLSFLIELRDFAAKRTEENKKKFFPTDEDLNPRFNFIENKVLEKIEDNRDFRKQHDKLKINWSEEQEMVRKAYRLLRDAKFYQKYLDLAEPSYEQDAEVLERIIKKVLIDFELLEYYYESKSVFWAFDSYLTANFLLIKVIHSFGSGENEYKMLPTVLREVEGDDDRKFMLDLFRMTILHSSEYEEMIDEKAKNWELERIALMDTLLIKMALAELLEFPSIPVKVSLNEYIDISKYYSSAKSKVFINGILDKLIMDLKEKKMIKKTGRGLME